MKDLKIILVAGARPNFMKVQPLLRRIEESNARRKSGVRRIEARLVHTGQHYDEKMSEAFFRDLGIKMPDVNLGIGSGSHAHQTAQILMSFEAVCERERPDWIVVVGDVNSTMACALVGAKMGFPIAHVEAGLRSFDRTMPEEINRLVTDAVADLLLTPSEDANQNLVREGIHRDRIKFVGNIMIDSLIGNLPRVRSDGILTELRLEPSRYIYVTLHRPSNVDERTSLSTILAALERLSRNLPVVFPVHPRTLGKINDFGLTPRSGDGLQLLDPLGYHASLRLIGSARLVLTDSGGLQEESTFFRTPCLTLRPNTERPVTVTLGSNRLTSLERLGEDIEATLDGPERLGQIPPLWDGLAAERIIEHLLTASKTGRSS